MIRPLLLTPIACPHVAKRSSSALYLLILSVESQIVRRSALLVFDCKPEVEISCELGQHELHETWADLRGQYLN